MKRPGEMACERFVIKLDERHRWDVQRPPAGIILQRLAQVIRIGSVGDDAALGMKPEIQGLVTLENKDRAGVLTRNHHSAHLAPESDDLRDQTFVSVSQGPSCA